MISDEELQKYANTFAAMLNDPCPDCGHVIALWSTNMVNEIRHQREWIKQKDEALKYYTEPVKFLSTFDPETEKPCVAIMATHYNKAYEALAIGQEEK